MSCHACHVQAKLIAHLEQQLKEIKEETEKREKRTIEFVAFILENRRKEEANSSADVLPAQQ